jgi:hypothetical protein
MRSAPVWVISVVLSAAVLLLSVAMLTHVHGISDPDARHTVADFLLQFQILTTVLLAWIAVLVSLSLQARRPRWISSRCPPLQSGTVHPAPRAPPPSTQPPTESA